MQVKTIYLKKSKQCSAKKTKIFSSAACTRADPYWVHAPAYSPANTSQWVSSPNQTLSDFAARCDTADERKIIISTMESLSRWLLQFKHISGPCPRCLNWSVGKLPCGGDGNFPAKLPESKSTHLLHAVTKFSIHACSKVPWVLTSQHRFDNLHKHLFPISLVHLFHFYVTLCSSLCSLCVCTRSIP